VVGVLGGVGIVALGQPAGLVVRVAVRSAAAAGDPVGVCAFVTQIVGVLPGQPGRVDGGGDVAVEVVASDPAGAVDGPPYGGSADRIVRGVSHHAGRVGDRTLAPAAVVRVRRGVAQRIGRGEQMAGRVVGVCPVVAGAVGVVGDVSGRVVGVAVG